MVTFFAQVQQELYFFMLFTPIMWLIISLEVEISSNVGSGSVKGSADSMVHSDSRLDFRRSLEFGYPPREETAGRVSDRLCL